MLTKTGILITQLGTPDEPTPQALRCYLKEFLSDRRVVENQGLLWWLVLNLIILTIRPRRSAKLYKEIWTKDGSPLLVITKSQQKALQELLGNSIPVSFGMSYGSPSFEQGIKELLEKGCTQLLLFPMYPQYSSATTGSTYESVFASLKKLRFIPTLKVIPPYYAHKKYLEALAAIINESLASQAQPVDRLVLSYHGLPLSFVEAGDPYQEMCKETTKGLKPLIHIEEGRIVQTYQSRFGSAEWLGPATDKTLETFPKQGIRRIAVACPSFPADCLETLSEIGIEVKELFLRAGGEAFTFIPCLNTSPVWIQAMREIVLENL